MKRVIIESAAAYQAARRQFGAEADLFWHTTSPYLLDTLQREKEKVCSLENGLDKETSVGMGMICFEITNRICEWLNVQCASWRTYLDFKLIFGWSCQLCLTTLVHKALLLRGLMDHQARSAEEEPLTVFGDPAVPVTGITVGFGGFDNLYACLAKTANHPRIKLFEFVIPEEQLQQIQRAIRYRRLSVLEKMLGILNSTPSAFLFKSWKNVNRWTRNRIGRIAMDRGRAGNAVIYRECELLDELFARLLVKGWRVSFLGRLPEIEERKDEAVGFSEEDILGQTLELFEARRLEHKIDSDVLMESALKLFAKRLLEVIRRLRVNIQRVVGELGKTVEGMGAKNMIFTNAMTDPWIRCFTYS